MKAKPSLCENLRAEVGRGDVITINLDAIKGVARDHILFVPIIQFLNEYENFSLTHIGSHRESILSSTKWSHPHDLVLPMELEVEWEQHHFNLFQASIMLTKKVDSLTWGS